MFISINLLLVFQLIFCNLIIFNYTYKKIKIHYN